MSQEYYIEQIQQSTDNDLQSIITSVLEDPQLFRFSKIIQYLQTNSVAHQPSIQLLNLFAFSNFSNYVQLRNQNQIQELNENQAHKLRILSLIELARSKKVISFADIADQLQIQNELQIIKFLFHCLQNQIIEGKIDQSNRQLQVYKYASRDIDGSHVQLMKTRVDNILKKLSTFEASIKNQIMQINDIKMDDVQKHAVLITQRHKILDQLRSQQ